MSPSADEPKLQFKSTSVHDISLFQSKLVITGTAQFTEDKIGIKSPFLMTLDRSLAITNTIQFKTKTTAQNVTLKPFDKNQSVLSFYGARSLKSQEEQTEIKVLDQDFKEINNIVYGNRTRIKDIDISNLSNIVTLNYERSTQEMSIKIFENFADEINMTIAESNETNIPIAINMFPNQDIIAAGIANGFHYLDGHNYEHPEAYGFLKKINPEGEVIRSYSYQHTGHVFFTDIMIHQNRVYVAGTSQSNKTGMDLLILSLDDQLNLMWERQILNDGIQESTKILIANEMIYILGKTENVDNHKMSLLLTQLDTNGNIKWKQAIGKESHSITPVDLVLYDSALILLTRSKENRMAVENNLLYNVSLSGDLLKEINLD